ncbi:MAG: hypothetical protein AB8B55_09275 [Mariniblastus sp.]
MNVRTLTILFCLVAGSFFVTETQGFAYCPQWAESDFSSTDDQDGGDQGVDEEDEIDNEYSGDDYFESLMLHALDSSHWSEPHVFPTVLVDPFEPDPSIWSYLWFLVTLP